MMLLRVLIVSLLCSITLAAGYADVSPPGSGVAHPPLISVTGKSEIWVAPDQYEFSVTLISVRPDAESAMKSNEELLERLRALLATFEVADRDFQVADVQLEHPYVTARSFPSIKSVAAAVLL